VPFERDRGRYLLIDERKYHEAEALFLRNAGFATFVGRLIPVIRHLISLPAGVFGMPLAAFLAITAAGAGLWCAILVGAGYYLGEPAVELFGLYVHELSIVVVVALVASALWFVLRKRVR
ncbi:MAG: VTT domain-containing protein, partial [Hydrocarboniphaga effusa]|nr:VTT domain-containing protein [Hydrocarboniphaga effusa]